MQLKNGRVEGAPFQEARWTGEQITPAVVVLHDTASRLTPGSAASYLADNARKVSVHFVVERDGKITQQVPVGVRANHAGRSHYHGRDYVNGFSVGIEIVNPGRMEAAPGGLARAWYGEEFDIDTYRIQEMRTEAHGHGFWMAYPEEQIEAVLDLLEALFDGCDTLEDIVTHWYISPGRKVDTNPLFPLSHVRARTLGREEPAELQADAAADDIDGDELLQVDTRGDPLNMRRWPSFNPNVIDRIPDGTLVPIIKAGSFSGRRWVKVAFGGAEGWVVENYLKEPPE